jgi:hypothetical protein
MTLNCDRLDFGPLGLTLIDYMWNPDSNSDIFSYLFFNSQRPPWSCQRQHYVGISAVYDSVDADFTLSL